MRALDPLVLLVSKPVAPPWNDSSKNLVKDLAQAGRRFRYSVFTPRGYTVGGERVSSEGIYRDQGSFTPPLLQNLSVLRRLLRSDESALAHFFFAPNPRAARAARLALRLRPRRTVQTVCSRPKSYADAQRLLFADHVVVLSEDTRRRFVESGVEPRRLHSIPPGIRIPTPDATARRAVREELSLPLDHHLVIYPGDYQFSSAAETVASAALQLADLPAAFIFACRIKQPASIEAEARVRAKLASGGALRRVRLLREVPDMLRLLSACDLCVLPAESLYAKMDLPLVLLEAMALGVPLVLADSPPLDELVRPGWHALVPPGDAGALARAVRRLLGSTERRLQLGEEARRDAVARFAIEEVSRRHEDLYQEVMQS